MAIKKLKKDEYWNTVQDWVINKINEIVDQINFQWKLKDLNRTKSTDEYIEKVLDLCDHIYDI